VSDAGASTPTWPDLLSRLLAGTDLPADDTAWVMGEIMSGEATPVQVAGFLVALRAKGETAAELDGLVRAMLAHARRIEVAGPTVDIVGTGGDRSNSVNISTMSALVAAGAGVRVVKHGNRAASSKCGAADVLEALGVALTLEPDDVAAVAVEAGITFCFAPVFHPGMRHAGVTRRELGVPTAFNFLGPLTNPAQPQAQAVGCADPRMAGLMAEVFAARGATALVFRGDDGLDELTTTTTSQVWVVRGGQVIRTEVDPARLGIAPATTEDLRGGDAAFNASVVRELLAGKPGPVRDAVVLNAASALVAADAIDAAPGTPLEDRLVAGMAAAAAAIDSGASASVLDRWVEATQRRTAS
jgi:anthranilate phosphoribosyltransferase